jgi:hypothetical protein
MLSIIAIALVSTSTHAWETPKKAILEFLTFETNGARLTNEKFCQYVTMYIAAPKEFAEPGWDIVTLIENYRLLGIKCPSSKRCQATVEFVLAPTRNLQTPSVFEHPDGGKEIKTYVIVKRGKSWLLEPDFSPPIITIQTYYRHKARHAL